MVYLIFGDEDKYTNYFGRLRAINSACWFYSQGGFLHLSGADKET